MSESKIDAIYNMVKAMNWPWTDQNPLFIKVSKNIGSRVQGNSYYLYILYIILLYY
jgi:hypothetical protein